MKQQTETKVLKLERQREQLDKQIKNAKQHVVWKCLHCNRGTQVRFLDLIVMNFYVPPSGCTDGAYWTEGDRPEYNVVCPKCNQRVRVYHSNLSCYNKDWLKTKFGQLEVARAALWNLTHSLRRSFKSEAADHRD